MRSPPPAAPAKVDIPYEQFTLPNGLRVRDRAYRSQGADRCGQRLVPRGQQGRTGRPYRLRAPVRTPDVPGQRNHDGEFFEPFKQVGATNQNGTTNTDRTNYFENVPTTALDMALWMESDRMGHLVGAIDQAALDEQRGVVQNEKRQGENQPYGQAWDQLNKALYPVGHPYHHGVIGSMNDLNAASLDDVKTWFRTWYGPNNAVLVLAGDIDLGTAKERSPSTSAASRPARPWRSRP